LCALRWFEVFVAFLEFVLCVSCRVRVAMFQVVSPRVASASLSSVRRVELVSRPLSSAKVIAFPVASKVASPVVSELDDSGWQSVGDSISNRGSCSRACKSCAQTLDAEELETVRCLPRNGRCVERRLQVISKCCIPQSRVVTQERSTYLPLLLLQQVRIFRRILIPEVQPKQVDPS
jgi:hypothetical protein